MFQALLVLFDDALSLICLDRENFLLALRMPQLILDLNDLLFILALIGFQGQDLFILLEQQILGEATWALTLLPLKSCP